MKIKRLCAANIREAMRRVREELGPEALILSTSQVTNGVEIMAAIDYDASLVPEEQPPLVAEPASAVPGPRDDVPAEAKPPGPTQLFASAFKSVVGAVKPAASASPPEPADLKPGGGKPRVVWSQDPLLLDMQNEIKRMHSLLEQQLAGLAWGELARRQPLRADLLSRLLDFGISPELCLRLASTAATERDPERAWKLALETLAHGLAITHDDILTQGGVVALLGPTGVGKTTTVAKLAARYILGHGPGQVALITTDSYRIGAFEQLRTFGMILGTPVRLASNHEELQTAVAEFANKSLILIDTAGMSQRDLRLSQQFTLIGATPAVKRYLVLAANAQTATLNEAVAAFAKVRLTGCILTKLDETTRLGGALSVIHERGLPLAYVSAGQRVPEDLQAAQVETLQRLGEELTRAPGRVDEDELLALTFGRSVANACV
jgi:flagellar biosynthesis protein FlhF